MLMYFIITGVGAIVFLHAFPLTDIQCYRYRLRHPHPNKVIWNNCWTTGERESTQIWFQVHERTLLLSLLESEYYNGFGRFDGQLDRDNDDIYNKTILTSWNLIVIITFAVISFLLLRASFQTGANDNSSELMGKNENNFAFNAEPCDRDYYGLGE